MYPILFQTKFFTIHSLWLFVAIAIIAGTYAFIKLGLKNGLKLQFLSEHSFKILIFSILGARIVAIAMNWTTFFYEYSPSTFLQIFKIWDKGLSLWGGVLAGLIALYLACKKNDQNFLKWLDALVPAFLIGIAISAIGTFLDGVNYGNETSLPWGVNFESPAIKYTVPIHPTQIYLLLYSALISTVLILGKDHKLFKHTGETAIVGIGLFSLIHFFQEFIRGDDVTMIFGIRFPQAVAFVIFVSALTFYFSNINKKWKL
ncbi:hypothetical protein HOE67_03320 [Candidatus Peregrinibacteria bacterium]|jgi:phosphatidylglycerol---prolipoprotein diacylglyceryl transferase|nr:hypothetical protein [Candidatus Peregrinibacteria bacterium]MBT4056116.1 hypothetical protein [Candidatus Peregrinibacteria bacterium]